MEEKRLKGQALSILVVLLVIIFLLLAVVIYLWYQRTLLTSSNGSKDITTYKECADAGYPIQDSYPSRCVTPDGKSFTNPDESVNEDSTTQTVSVYFVKNTDSDPNKTYGTKRDVTILSSTNVETVSLESLITGPSEEEQLAYSYYSPLLLSGSSNCGQADFTLTIEDKVATVKFCKSLKLNGILDDARVIASVTKTLKQFPTITSVVILTKDGNCVGDLSGMNSCKS